MAERVLNFPQTVDIISRHGVTWARRVMPASPGHPRSTRARTLALDRLDLLILPGLWLRSRHLLLASSLSSCLRTGSRLVVDIGPTALVTLVLLLLHLKISIGVIWIHLLLLLNVSNSGGWSQTEGGLVSGVLALKSWSHGLKSLEGRDASLVAGEAWSLAQVVDRQLLTVSYETLLLDGDIFIRPRCAS
jgi:hypothetical protein